MAEVEIARPGASCEADSDPEGLWILPEAWKTLGTAEKTPRRPSCVSHTSLDGAARRPQAPQALQHLSPNQTLRCDRMSLDPTA
jgi:hypothetical protein